MIRDGGNGIIERASETSRYPQLSPVLSISMGGSIRDVQALARHSSLQMTQRYIEVSEDAMRRVINNFS